MTETAPQRVIERIQSRISVDGQGGCWTWPGATSCGYGRIAYVGDDGRKIWAGVHRVMYAAAFGPIPAGMDIDHVCHDPALCSPNVATDCPHRRCCNPDHLRAVTRRENLLRGGTVAALRTAATRCPAGHEYTSENTLTDRLGRRSCKECTYERNRAYYHSNKERRAAYNKAWRAKRKAQK